jgi:hypothetical protein
MKNILHSLILFPLIVHGYSKLNVWDLAVLFSGSVSFIEADPDGDFDIFYQFYNP